MSSLYLAVALAATFFAFALAGVTVATSRWRRREALRVLQAHVGPAAGFSLDLREQELARSFVDRSLLPLLSRLAAMTRRVTPADMRTKVERKLMLAGRPAGWDAEKVMALKVLGLGAAVFVLLFFSMVGSAPFSRVLLFAGLVAFIGYFGVDAVLERKARERQDAIRKALPDTMDLLTISVEAGLSFDAALMQVMNNVPGPLSDEIGRMLQEMRLGVGRVDALRSLAARTDVEELQSFVLAMVQADAFGVSISNVLRAQSKELRTKRRQRAEEKAMQIPVKILFPLIFCVMPSLFVVVLGPGVIRIWQDFFGGGM